MTDKFYFLPFIYLFIKLVMCHLGCEGERINYILFASNTPKVRLGLNYMFGSEPKANTSLSGVDSAKDDRRYNLMRGPR